MSDQKFGVQPYLFFNGRCQEALEYYRRAIGAEIGCVMLFKESPDKASIPPGAEDKVMHASFKIGGSELMASDGCAAGTPKFEGISLSLNPATVPDGERIFNALAEGGQIQMPMTETFFAQRFGMVADRFGMSWMIYVPPASKE